MIDTCSSGQYYLDTFKRGIVFYTLATVDSSGGITFMKGVLQGKSDDEIWMSLADYERLYDYYDFNKRPSEQ
jgi:hypothetical protein